MRYKRIQSKTEKTLECTFILKRMGLHRFLYLNAESDASANTGTEPNKML